MRIEKHGCVSPSVISNRQLVAVITFATLGDLIPYYYTLIKTRSALSPSKTSHSVVKCRIRRQHSNDVFFSIRTFSGRLFTSRHWIKFLYQYIRRRVLVAATLFLRHQRKRPQEKFSCTNAISSLNCDDTQLRNRFNDVVYIRVGLCR